MTASRARAMRDRAPFGEGARRESAQQRRRWLVVGALLGIGIPLVLAPLISMRMLGAVEAPAWSRISSISEAVGFDGLLAATRL
jgi:hypothetical protein